MNTHKQIFQIKSIQILVLIHKAIQMGRTGGQHEFAEKMHMHPTTLARRLDQLAQLGADIAYDKLLNSYYYKNHFDLRFEIKYDE